MSVAPIASQIRVPAGKAIIEVIQHSVDFRVQCIVADGGAAAGAEIGIGNLTNYDGANVRVPVRSASLNWMSFISVNACTPRVAMNKTMGIAVVPTGANWKYRFTASRGW
jgi:hypothetical protein